MDGAVITFVDVRNAYEFFGNTEEASNEYRICY